MESGLAIGAVVTYLFGATYTNTLSLGTTILATILALGTLVGVLYGAKWKSRWDQAQATIDLYAKNAAGQENRANLAIDTATQSADRAATEKDTLLHQLVDTREEIGRLRALPDLAGLVELAQTHDKRAQERFEAGEARSQERHFETVEVLRALVLRLEPEATPIR